MAEIATEPRPALRTQATDRLAIHPVARLAGAVGRTAELSDELLRSLEAGERATVEALGQFVIAIEEAFPQQVSATSSVAKTITESGLQMADRLVHAQHEFVRNVIDSIAKSLRSGGAAQPKVASS
jgi:hypothetical protein